MDKRYLFSGDRLDTGETIQGDLLHRDYGDGDICPVIVVHNESCMVGRSDDHKVDYDTVKLIVNIEHK